MPKRRKLHVFLCYASSDKLKVRELYDRLSASDWIQPWIDEEELLPGDDWHLEIEKAIEESDAVLVCLSKTAISKVGFVQKEMRFILDVADEQPEGKVFVIPLLLDDCHVQIPRRLSRWQHADYSSEHHLEREHQKLIKSLEKIYSAKAPSASKKTFSKSPGKMPVSETKKSAKLFQVAMDLVPPAAPVSFSSPIKWVVRLRSLEKATVHELRLLWGDEILADNFDLLPGETKEFTHTREYDTQGERVEKVSLMGAGVQKEASAKVIVNPPPSILAMLTPEKKQVMQTEPVHWVLSIKNNGSENLSMVLVKRDDDILEKISSLAVGQAHQVEFEQAYDTPRICREIVNIVAMAAGGEFSWQARAEIQVQQVIDTFGGLEFALIPRGAFLMGSKNDDDMAYDDEKPRHTVEIAENYWMARYPVTNAQFARFVEATGYRTTAEELGAGSVFLDGRWQTVAGVSWRKPGTEDDILIPLLGRDNHPVALVSWHDAREFCRWMNAEYGHELPDGMMFRLPTEAEWEKAARGEDALHYPWGNSQPTPEQLNANRKYDGTTAVWIHSPQGDSPYGLADMAGNVWEWTNSLFREYPYKHDDGREDPDSSLPRVLRGGSFLNAHRNARCSARSSSTPETCISYYGFRVVIVPSLSDVSFVSVKH